MKKNVYRHAQINEKKYIYVLSLIHGYNTWILNHLRFFCFIITDFSFHLTKYKYKYTFLYQYIILHARNRLKSNTISKYMYQYRLIWNLWRLSKKT